MIAQSLDCGIGKRGPAQSLMTVGLMSTHSQRGIQEQNALLSPSCEISISRHRLAKIHFNLLEDIDK